MKSSLLILLYFTLQSEQSMLKLLSSLVCKDVQPANIIPIAIKHNVITIAAIILKINSLTVLFIKLHILDLNNLNKADILHL